VKKDQLEVKKAGKKRKRDKSSENSAKPQEMQTKTETTKMGQ
jgi:hypothetical protein